MKYASFTPDELYDAFLDDNIITDKKELHKKLKQRWGQYQWENDHAPHIDPKSIFIALGTILILIGILILI